MKVNNIALLLLVILFGSILVSVVSSADHAIKNNNNNNDKEQDKDSISQQPLANDNDDDDSDEEDNTIKLTEIDPVMLEAIKKAFGIDATQSIKVVASSDSLKVNKDKEEKEKDDNGNSNSKKAAKTNTVTTGSTTISPSMLEQFKISSNINSLFENNLLFKSHNDIDLVQTSPLDKDLPGRNEFIEGQRLRGLVLVEKTNINNNNNNNNNDKQDNRNSNSNRQDKKDNSKTTIPFYPTENNNLFLRYSGDLGTNRDHFEYIGDSHIDMIDSLRALNQLELSAELGNHRAMYVLGIMHEIGDSGIIVDFKKAEYWYLKAAEHGNSDAQKALGFIYATGKLGYIDEPKAILYYTFAAKSGNIIAQLSLAYRYANGYGTEKSCMKSAKLYEFVARQYVSDYESRGFGYNIPHERLSDFAPSQSSDEEDVVEFLRYSASIGDPSSLVTMANLYLQGGPVTQDFRLAFGYYRDAASQDFAAGLAGLGFMYNKGYGVPQDNKTAVYYFKKAQALGHPVAQAHLGYMLLNGYGVPKDTQSAIKHLTESAEKGTPEALVHLGKIYLHGIGGVEKDINKAFGYFSTATKFSNPVAIYQIGKYVLDNFESDCERAVDYFKRVSEKGAWSMALTDAHRFYEAGEEQTALLFFEKAAEMGIETAQYNAGYMYDKKLGVYSIDDDLDIEEKQEKDVQQDDSGSNDDEEKTNINIEIQDSRPITTLGYTTEFIYQQAFRNFYRSSKQNNAEAHLKIGDFYYYGKGVEKSIEKAADFYQLSASLLNSQALFNLGYMHQYGEGTPQDLFLAKRYYDMALHIEPQAYFPIYISLMSLLFHFIYLYVHSFFNPSIQFSSTANENSQHLDHIGKSAARRNQMNGGGIGGGGVNDPASGSFNGIEMDELDELDFNELVHNVEAYLMIIIALIIGYIVVRRQRVILREQRQRQNHQVPLNNNNNLNNNHNNQQQQQPNFDQIQQPDQ
ncbi:hypothetical protein CYY_008851 [Polysphondylium violaceum]|uniref:Uncharacterized protein n=1 Tax=Polysphondylium violaceum TaxID=133409 RepID=A0A8J4PPT7_9MYCE|nr:hypothetical protein CYY_008851 [Polysphondylium violaceum]